MERVGRIEASVETKEQDVNESDHQQNQKETEGGNLLPEKLT